MALEISQCKDCRAKVVLLTKKVTYKQPVQKVIEIDFHPSPDGNVLINENAKTYQIVKPKELEKARRLKLVMHKQHYLTCAAKEKFRKK